MFSTESQLRRLLESLIYLVFQKNHKHIGEKKKITQKINLFILKKDVLYTKIRYYRLF